jgi:hypothetical protein
MVLAQAAADRFNKLSSDLALGHVRGDARVGWHVVDNDIDVRQRQLLRRRWLPTASRRLNSLLDPPQYGALRTALSIAPPTDAQKINKIRLNMDRWRWLPGSWHKYIIVNAGVYTTLVENGVTRWKHRRSPGDQDADAAAE